jgi:hypothetical protein
MTWGLGKGQLSDTTGVIFTVGAGENASVKSIIFHNTNSTAETVELFLVNNNGGAVGTAVLSDRKFSRPLASGETYIYSVDFPLEGTQENDTIQASSTTSSQVNYIVNGRIN